MTDLEKSIYTPDEVRNIVTQALENLQAEHNRLKQHSKILAQHLQKQDRAQPVALDGDRMTECLDELKEISRHMGQSINDIIQRAQKMERMLATYMFPEKQKLIDEIVRIMESCSVHDITTQRIYKIRNILGDSSVPLNYRTPADGRKVLESGPQLPAEAMSQADIDRLLNS